MGHDIINTLKTKGGFITSGEVSSRGDYDRLRESVADGSVLRLKKGVYASSGALSGIMIDVERIVSGGVLCLYSAFSYHRLSTQIPASYCVAIDAKRKVALPAYPPIDLFYWKKENLGFGIAKEYISGYEVRITDLERTVCDAVKYRNKIGLDVCGEILDSFLRRSDRNISLLYDYARKLRVYNTITKYLETRL